MTITTKVATLFSVLGLLVGSAVAVGFHVHAQSVVTPTLVPTSVSVATPTPSILDKDNIQDTNGPEKVDAPDGKEVTNPVDKQDQADENTVHDQEKAD